MGLTSRGGDWTVRDHAHNPDNCSYAGNPYVGNIGVYYANLSAYVPPKNNGAADIAKGNGLNWHERYRTMLKRNPFGIIVLNEANRDLQAMMQEGEEEIPVAWTTAGTALAAFPGGPPRPPSRR